MIEAAVAADTFTVSKGQLLCIKSDGNYAVVYMMSDGKVEHRLIRQTMDRLEEQLQYYPQFIRTHRAYIINQDHLINYHGNAAGYKLTLAHLDFKVPVSRANVRKLEQLNTVI